jgi:glutaredoxin 2
LSERRFLCARALQDVDYTRWTHTRRGFDYADAEAATPALLAVLQPYLLELEGMLRGRDPAHGDVPTLNAWGLSMDDALVLPILRSLTVVQGIEWPPLVWDYVETACADAGVSLFTEYAS